VCQSSKGRFNKLKPKLSRRSFIKATGVGLGALLIPFAIVSHKKNIVPSPRPFNTHGLSVGDKITISDYNKVFTVTEIHEGKVGLK